MAGLKATGHDALATALQDNAVNIGQARGNSTGWWGGLGGELTMFDPFRFAFDAGYSTLDTDYSALDRSGWLLGLSMSYKTAWGVPTLKFWYTSGDDGNVKNGSERPLITGDFNIRRVRLLRQPEPGRQPGLGLRRFLRRHLGPVRQWNKAPLSKVCSITSA